VYYLQPRQRLRPFDKLARAGKDMRVPGDQIDRNHTLQDA
jgi:hypothetical protein